MNEWQIVIGGVTIAITRPLMRLMGVELRRLDKADREERLAAFGTPAELRQLADLILAAVDHAEHAARQEG